MRVRFAGIDPSRPSDQDFLSDVQMGILKGHGRRFSSYTLLKLPEIPSVRVRKFIRELPVASASEQIAAADIFRRDGRGSSVFCMLALSATGYRKLSIETKCWPTDRSFLKGMKWASNRVLGDPPIDKWEAFFQDDVDVLIVLANESLSVLRELEARVTEEARALDAHVRRIDGIRLGDPSQPDVENFGFADGISQPLFFKRDIDQWSATWSGVHPDFSFDPRNLVLARNGRGYGSYLTLRKISQSRQNFDGETRRISSSLSADEEFVAAQAMGRHRDGSPLALTGAGGGQPSNAFNFEDDPTGRRCPFHSHIRKLNPRTNSEEDAYRSVARRGVLYSDRSQEPQEDGLLFLCMQADIGRQFEFMQSRWANDRHFPRRNAGIDPIIGTSSGGRSATWMANWNSLLGAADFSMAAVTSFRGGEYFFVPPISFIEDLR